MSERASAIVDLVANDSRFNAAMRRVETRMASVRRKMQGVADAARKVFLAGVAGATAATVAFGSFEQKMARVKALTDATGTSFAKLNKLARDLGKATVFSANQAAEAMGFLALAGFKVEEIMGALPDVLNLAAAGQLDMATAATISAKIIRGMNLDVQDLSRVVDVLAKAFTTSNTDLAELGEAMKFVGPIAASAGISLEGTVAALQALADSGFSASLGGTALRTALVKLQTVKVAKFFREFGLSVETANGRLKSIPELVGLTREALSQVGGEVERTAKLFELFGLRGGPGMQILLRKGEAGLRSLEKTLKSAGGTADKIAKTQLDTLFGSFKLIASAAAEAAIAMGEQFEPTVSKLTGTVQGLIDAFNKLQSSTKSIIAQFVTWGIALAGLVFVLPKLLMLVGKFATTLVVAKFALGAIATAAALLGGPLTIAIGLAAAALTVMKLGWSAFISTIDDGREVLEKATTGLNDLAKARREFAEAGTAEARKTFTKPELLEKEIAALEAKGAAIKKTIEEVGAEVDRMSDPDIDVGFNLKTEQADRGRLVQLGMRQLFQLEEQEKSNERLLKLTRKRLETEKIRARMTEERASKIAEMTDAMEKQQALDDKGFAVLDELSKRFRLLTGELTEDRLVLIDLKNLDVSHDVIRAIADKQRQIADFKQEELDNDKQGLLNRKEELRVAGLKARAQSLFVASLTDEERLQRKISEIAFLEAEGIFNAQQAAKVRASLAEQPSRKGELVSGESLFRRISEAAGARGPGATAIPAATTAKATVKTAEQTKTANVLSKKQNVTLEGIFDLLTQFTRGDFTAVFG